MGCSEDSGWREGACVGECLGLRSSQWQEPDTSKLNVDPWVQLVLVGVDTNRQIDPIKKAMMADRPGRLTRLSCSHLYSLELSLQTLKNAPGLGTDWVCHPKVYWLHLLPQWRPMLLQAVFEAGVTCWGLGAELYLCGREGG